MAYTSAPDGVLLHGMQAIADFLGIERRSAYHLADAKQIPTFKMGRTVCATKAGLTAAIKAREASAISGEAESQDRAA